MLMNKRLAGWTLFLAATGVPFADASPMLASAGSTDVRVVDRKHSQFNGDIAVVDAAGIRMLIADARQGIVLQSSMDLIDKTRLVSTYTQIMSILTSLQGKPSEVLDMGLGGGVLPRFHLSRYPRSKVDSIEIDPAVIEIARKYFSVENPRHQVLEGDGLEVTERQNQKYDVIWVDELTPKAGPNAVVQTRFLTALETHLTPDGIVVANLGPAPKWDQYRDVIDGYKRSYRFGVRVTGPNRSIEAFREATGLVQTHSHSNGLHDSDPNHFIAVGNNPALTCKKFWQTYSKWVSEKLAAGNLWPASSAYTPEGFCADL